jgi:hypothetical protein
MAHDAIAFIDSMTLSSQASSSSLSGDIDGGRHRRGQDGQVERQACLPV